MAIQMKVLYDHNKKKGLTNVNIKGLEKAVDDFNTCQSAAVVYFDKKELTIWTAIHEGLELHDEYMDQNIVILLQKGTHDILFRNDKTTMADLELLCKIELAFD